ncbi:hypothetical protein M378DRAFT_156012 [Amanita muscaria Koide BX008]|uniref:Uncharacterized protein n=1 Tax=Amanita muscaria (strain Koide BX008) TaxID=946122 RepID=A0A0C2TUT7_AMAMK|nr:hypothetical protein M378DRAFT_156012 [Amanita muscaria Koide BX008]
MEGGWTPLRSGNPRLLGCWRCPTAAQGECEEGEVGGAKDDDDGSSSRTEGMYHGVDAVCNA